MYSRSSPVFLCTVLATCCDVAKEVLRGTYRDATEDYSFVYESVSEVVLQNNQVVVLDVEAKEMPEEVTKVQTEILSSDENCGDNGLPCDTLQSETTKLTVEQND